MFSLRRAASACVCGSRCWVVGVWYLSGLGCGRSGLVRVFVSWKIMCRYCGQERGSWRHGVHVLHVHVRAAVAAALWLPFLVRQDWSVRSSCYSALLSFAEEPPSCDCSDDEQDPEGHTHPNTRFCTACQPCGGPRIVQRSGWCDGACGRCTGLGRIGGAGCDSGATISCSCCP